MKKYPYKRTLTIGEKEFWWGGAVAHGIRMPLSKSSAYTFDSNENKTDNQFNGVFVSTEGRYIAVDGECKVIVEEGEITVEARVEPKIGVCKDLRQAQLCAIRSLYDTSKTYIRKDLLLSPQFCTWTDMGIHVSQEKILRYAQSVVEAGFDHKLLIIDDGWSLEYGDWRVDERKIPDPKAMMDALHEMGFQLSLWLVPFVNEKAKDYEYLKANDALVRKADGSVKICSWWNGKDAVLDLTSPIARQWITDTLNALQEKYGVDGFKFDAGDETYYSYEDLTNQPVSPSGQCALWSEIAKQYEISEIRSGVGNGLSHLITRLNDKRLSWSKEENGLGAIIPNMIQAGINGYPFTCPDMVGEGGISDFNNGVQDESYELAVRFCQCCTLMPSMQFSYSYWNKSPLIKKLYSDCLALRASLREYLDGLIDNALHTGEPIVRSLEYVFPGQGYEQETDCFMYGDTYLVAPVLALNQREITVRLPKGSAWTYMPSGKEYEGGATITVDAPLEVVPYFRRG